MKDQRRLSIHGGTSKRDHGSFFVLQTQISIQCVGRALTSICKDIGNESYGKFAIQFWEPKNSSRDPAQKYKDCWSSTWIMENQRFDMTHVDSILYASYSKIQNPKFQKIPK